MKRIRFIILTCIFMFLAAIFAGCANRGASNMDYKTTWNVADAEPAYVIKWPENKYTAQIRKPKNGEMDFILDCSDDGRYALFLKKISEEEAAEYIEDLKADGYSKIFFKGNDVSVGTMLKKDNITLSISYSGESLGILITMDEESAP